MKKEAALVCLVIVLAIGAFFMWNLIVSSGKASTSANITGYWCDYESCEAAITYNCSNVTRVDRKQWDTSAPVIGSTINVTYCIATCDLECPMSISEGLVLVLLVSPFFLILLYYLIIGGCYLAQMIRPDKQELDLVVVNEL